MYRVTKTYGHERGISCAFRQHKAKSHCKQLHGYALSFSFVFESDKLNENKWVIDFGSLKPLEAALKDHFDHKTVMAKDDPAWKVFKELQNVGVIDLVTLPFVGCEAFARHAYCLALPIVNNVNFANVNHVRIVSVTVAEHGANSATYIPNNES